jgi:N-acetylmuramoyl-L-alanine amidase
MTDNLLTVEKYSRPGILLTQVMGLVVHWTAMPGQSPSGVRMFYESDEAAENHYGSAHYGVGIDGEVQRWIPEDEVAYHVGSSIVDPASGRIYTDLARQLFPGYCEPTTSPNHVTLGIECCIPDATGKFSPDTLGSLTALVRDIIQRYELGAVRLIRHYDVVGWKLCPLWYVKNPDEWLAFKRMIYEGITQSPSAVEREKTGGEL